MPFVRKNLLTISGQFFTPGFGVGDNDADDAGRLPQPQPSSVTCVLNYFAPMGTELIPLSATIVLALQTDGLTWKGTWDSSVAKGRVDWMVYSAGSVIAAAEGNFVVKANSANVTVP
jgi:hypothetical protein